MTQPVPDNEAVRQPTPEQKVLAAQSQALARALQMLRQEYQSLLCELGELIDGLTQWQGEVEGDEADRCDLLARQAAGILTQQNEILNRALQYLGQGYRSFLGEVAVFLDGLARWQEEPEGDPAGRCDELARQGTGMLLQHGVRPTARVGQPLDLRYHEVVASEPDGNVAPDTILRVLEMGYEMVHASLGRFTLRPARVIVSAAAQTEDEAERAQADAAQREDDVAQREDEEEPVESDAEQVERVAGEAENADPPAEKGSTSEENEPRADNGTVQ